MEFIDPPPPKRRNNSAHWTKVVAELEAQPGVWGFVGDYSVGVSTHIKKGRYRAFYPADLDKAQRDAYIKKHWEMTTRVNGKPNRVDLFIRWVG